MLWHEKGGSGASAILLLHGLGATAGVWMGVVLARGEHDAMAGTAELSLERLLRR